MNKTYSPLAMIARTWFILLLYSRAVRVAIDTQTVIALNLVLNSRQNEPGDDTKLFLRKKRATNRSA